MFGQWTAPCTVPQNNSRDSCYPYFIYTLLLIHIPAGVGMFGGLICLFWESIRQYLRKGASSESAKSATHVVFASMRFVNGQALPEALQLRDALQERGVHLKIVELTAGADINEEVFESIEHAEAFLVFGTSNYGEKTPNPACEPPPACPTKLLNSVAFARAQMHLLRVRVRAQRRQEDDPAAHDRLERQVRAPAGPGAVRDERAGVELEGGGADAAQPAGRHRGFAGRRRHGCRPQRPLRGTCASVSWLGRACLLPVKAQVLCSSSSFIGTKHTEARSR